MRKRLAEILKAIGTASVSVVGDVMLDEYIIGDSDRISPEAPEPIITEQARRYVPGGAANVAVNINALGAKAHLFSIIGNDTEGKLFKDALKKAGVDTAGILTFDSRPTTRKTRLIARGNQVLRVDREITRPIDSSLEQRLVRLIMDVEDAVIVVSDYAKGIVTPGLIKSLVDTGKRVIVDPKSSDLGIYAGSFLLTPNLLEISKAAGSGKLSNETIENVSRTVMDRHNINNILVTLGSEGMALYEKNTPVFHIHSKAREVYDVTGAGDTVIATVSAAVAAGFALPEACHTANIAAGIVVGKHFTAITSPQEIMEYAFGVTASEKIVSKPILLDRISELKETGNTIVFTNGCFDILHMGHITYLNEARGLGDILIVGVNTDRSVRALKGELRPIIPEVERSHVIAALECVDYVILFDEDTPYELIKDVLPDILVKGADYSRDEVVGHDIVESYGGKVVLLPLLENTSTSSIINRIKEHYDNK
ncbi:MAG: D-glycero-beta-D-manno-heptose 1-phosphate adenylyltransferase [Candidatus Latescibacteria bacterium]|nr:D-glycero-beta-D-manno-heptose 1-phosphate adenylyltransferase [Candidatus Latescibacterota bacterium]